MSTPAQVTAAGQATAQDSQTAREARFIWLHSLLRGSKSCDVLHAHYDKQKGTTARSRVLRDALFTALCLLHTDIRECARHVKEHGQLLFAFEGTTALQGLWE